MTERPLLTAHFPLDLPLAALLLTAIDVVVQKHWDNSVFTDLRVSTDGGFQVWITDNP